MSNYLIGTAGHVGHGKTTLIKALADTNAEKINNENRQKSTKYLDFTHFTLSTEKVCSIIDVPGYKKYINDVIAGLGGVDCVLLAVDAEEGIMQQTREHFEIIQLLDVQACIPVITGIDKVERNVVNEIEKNIKDLMKGSSYTKSTVMKVSAITGEGIDKLISAIEKTLNKLTPRDTEGSFRMPVDQVYNLPGVGTVVTGSIYQGATEKERMVEILPTGKRGKVRHVQVYDRTCDKAEAGQRAVLNISKIEERDIRRGDQVIRPGLMKPTLDLDTRVEVLASSPHPLKNKVKVRLHIATGETFGQIILLDRETLEPGESGYARILLETQIGALPEDRFIMRAPSGIYTWGGGKVIDPHPPHHRRFDKSVIDMLKLKDKGDNEVLVESIMKKEPYKLYNQEMLTAATYLSLEEAGVLISKMQKKDKLYRNTSGRFQLLSVMNKLADKTYDILEKLQDLQPDRLGRSLEEVKRNLSKVDSGLFREIIVYLKDNSKIQEKNGLLVTSDFSPELTPEQQEVYAWIVEEFNASDFTPPTKGDLHLNKKFKKPVIDHVIDYMIFTGELVSIDDNVFLTPGNLEKAKRIIGNYIIKHGGIIPGQVRELLGTTRKYVIPLLEYLDKTYFTRRKDGKRVLFRENIVV
jgi:selenocysteine-specific elongation factor